MSCGLAAGKGKERSLKGEAMVRIVCWDDKELRAREDSVAVEEPLKVHVDGTLSLVTMRTPRAERELAAGYCLSEGVIDSLRDIGAIEYCGEADGNRVDVIQRAGGRPPEAPCPSKEKSWSTRVAASAAKM